MSERVVCCRTPWLVICPRRCQYEDLDNQFSNMVIINCGEWMSYARYEKSSTTSGLFRNATPVVPLCPLFVPMAAKPLAVVYARSSYLTPTQWLVNVNVETRRQHTSIDAPIPSSNISSLRPRLGQPKLKGNTRALRRGNVKRYTTQVRRHELRSSVARRVIVWELEGCAVGDIFEAHALRVVNQLLWFKRQASVFEVGVSCGAVAHG